MTIFITSFQSLISRNILGTPLLSFLKSNNVQVVLLVPQKKKDFFEEEFREFEVVVESIDTKLQWQDKFLRYLFLTALKTRTLDIKRETEMKGSGKWLKVIIRNSSIGRKMLRWLNAILTPRNTFKDSFQKYNPDLVFSTDAQNEIDVRLLLDAKRNGVSTIGMVRSWDNLTAKGVIRVIPDLLAVHNEILKEEAITLHGIPEERIKIIGIPHYDRYFQGSHSSREEFMKRIGANPQKKLILFAPTGDRYIGENTVDKEVLEILDKNIGEEYQILVRFPPADTVSGLDGRENNSRFIFDRPSRRFKVLKNTELTKEEDAHLVDSIYWSDLIIAGPSTLCVDAAVFNKPIVLVGFDGYEKRPYYQGIRRYYDYNHFDPILKSGGVKLAENAEALAKSVKAYLQNPFLDEQGRRAIVRQECWNTDGKATERLANSLISALK
ncbi:MAG: CDP-glycerol glycerophosphotransferase family protein [Candidatus Harrisonbacteria bacterium]|nr:CDP-glycerol glycerophosphotransferase family protein [Candidatus Harrisonbacteria bacterium]